MRSRHSTLATAGAGGTRPAAASTLVWLRFALTAGLQLLIYCCEHSRSGDSFEQSPVVLLVLVGVGHREVGDGVVEVLAAAEVAGRSWRRARSGRERGQAPSRRACRSS